jgi:hypothetical protein
MKKSAYPLRIELESYTNEGEWKVMLIYRVTSPEMLFKKFEDIKTLYGLNKEYRIFIYANSKVNTYIEK